MVDAVPTWIPCDGQNRWVSEQGRFLSNAFSDTYSQFGEDGLIASCLETFGAANKWCFEVGAHDGYFMSNTLRLRDQGWDAVLIEADAAMHTKCAEKYASEHVKCYCSHVSGVTLDWLLEKAGAPVDLDFGVIDIDGQDYWVWKRLERHQPRLMLIEYGYWNPQEMLPVEDGNCMQDGNQANWQQICSLGAHKGYAALARTQCNVLFARNDILCCG